MIHKLFAIATVAFVGLLATPNAEAGHSTHASITYVSGHASCGCPIQTRRYVRTYDCYRRPIFGYSRVAFSHGSSCRLRAHSRSPHSHGPVIHRTTHSCGPRIVISSRSHDHSSPSHFRGIHSDSSSRGRTCR
ncbi:MAG: hypothetical protein OSB65_02930 [Roseibacillus sp.]|nr:hypothetical protein [Roseibacillus sp.]